MVARQARHRLRPHRRGADPGSQAGFAEEASGYEHPFPGGSTVRQLANGPAPLRDLVLAQATEAGLIGGDKTERVSARVSRKLLSAAKAISGIDSDTELVEYALSKVALEDDFGRKLLERKGSIPADIEL